MIYLLVAACIMLWLIGSGVLVVCCCISGARGDAHFLLSEQDEYNEGYAICLAALDAIEKRKKQDGIK